MKVDGKTKFPCVRGPEFDAHPVNWDAMLLRMKQFLPEGTSPSISGKGITGIG